MPKLAIVPLLFAGALLCSGFATPASGQVANGKKQQTNASHAAHLIQAEKDLLAAEGALSAGNKTGAHQAVAAAEKQVHQAVTHHSNVVAKFPVGNGFTGLIMRTQHHAHHGLLQQALHHMQAAQKSINANAGTAALEHVELSGRMIKATLLSHQQVIGR